MDDDREAMGAIRVSSRVDGVQERRFVSARSVTRVLPVRPSSISHKVIPSPIWIGIWIAACLPTRAWANSLGSSRRR